MQTWRVGRLGLDASSWTSSKHCATPSLRVKVRDVRWLRSGTLLRMRQVQPVAPGSMSNVSSSQREDTSAWTAATATKRSLSRICIGNRIPHSARGPEKTYAGIHDQSLARERGEVGV